ncbi:hypothetical protein DFR58_11310 [Anaerobacterium chartisolvens]|uniref:Lipoprotein n=1 Tax=Anaerobacterium chartisolvens TaxID=1297424 RepID=A0A369B180_9FIRM|nr:hypothetical protein [Anaerobacterium chartisolvens]RCX15430.1 hypothetical protein DFR58_11310 [Anaerobacterium chartisolvens]
MRKFSRIFAVLAVAVFTLSMLVGCSSDEITVFDALNKMSDIKSMETDSVITFKMDVSGISEEEKALNGGIVTALNGSKLDISQKIIRNDKKTVAKQQAGMKMDFMGMQMNMGVWADVNLAGDKPKINQIISIPPILTMSMPEQFRGKQYMVMDFENMLSETDMPSDYLKKLMNLGREFEPKLTMILKNYILNVKDAPKLITAKGKGAINDKEVSVYQLKLDDAAFKTLLGTTVNDLSQRKDVMSFINELAHAAIETAAYEDLDVDTAKAEFDESFEMVQDQIPVFLEEFNRVMEVFKDVKIIGDKGVVVDYFIDNNGYIIKQNLSINIVVDAAAIEKAMNEVTGNDAESYAQGVYNLEIDVKSDTKNINKPVNIEFPKVNAENSFNYSEFMNSTAEF